MLSDDFFPNHTKQLDSITYILREGAILLTCIVLVCHLV